ncbi:MAG: FkbM family methyltransferase [Vicinamibacterales bacterium]
MSRVVSGDRSPVSGPSHRGGELAVRPLLLRILPDRLRLSAWSRLYRGSAAGRLPLYSAAALRFAPGLTMRLLPGDVISDSIAFTGIYELPLSRRVMDLAGRGGTLVEVGANLGYFSLLWASARAGNRCVAFEASPRNVEMLRHNVERNHLDQQVRVVPRAAGASAGTLTFDVGPPNQTGWGGFTNRTGDGAIEVDVVRVDETLATAEPIALLKVDAEGADAWVLEGCDGLLRTGAIREVWYEQNKPRMTALGIPLDAPRTYLRSVGYAASPERGPDGDVVEWRAVPA